MVHLIVRAGRSIRQIIMTQQEINYLKLKSEITSIDPIYSAKMTYSAYTPGWVKKTLHNTKVGSKLNSVVLSKDITFNSPNSNSVDVILTGNAMCCNKRRIHL